jgi:DNA-binding MarR family transcriptional regulator
MSRWLGKIAEETMRPPDFPVSAPGVRLILMDVFANPDSPIGEIASRTGLPQSYVSESVSRLREAGAMETRVDTADGRRTLVRVSESVPKTVARLGAVSVDGALIEAMGEVEAGEAEGLVQSLEAMAKHLRTTRGGPGSQSNRLAAAGDS